MLSKSELDWAVRLEQWFVRARSSDGYTPPELNPPCLGGRVFGHPRKEDGKHVTTSPITESQGRFVKTRSGTVYRLGAVAASYRAFLRKHHPNWDWRNPITTSKPWEGRK